MDLKLSVLHWEPMVVLLWNISIHAHSFPTIPIKLELGFDKIKAVNKRPDVSTHIRAFDVMEFAQLGAHK